jgi:hypothetical protein
MTDVYNFGHSDDIHFEVAPANIKQ